MTPPPIRMVGPSGETINPALVDVDGASVGDVLAVLAGPVAGWGSLSSLGGGMVPTYIGPTETFTVPTNRQALFAMTIENDGTLIVDGFLIAVD